MMMRPTECYRGHNVHLMEFLKPNTRFPFATYSLFAILLSCQSSNSVEGNITTVKLITLDPGHFHAALVQKSMYANVDSVVHVYAPEGPDVKLHLARIDGFNSRSEQPTQWM